MNNYPLSNNSIIKKLQKIKSLFLFLSIVTLTVAVLSFREKDKKLLVFQKKATKENLDFVQKLASGLKTDVSISSSADDFSEEKLKDFATVICLTSPFEFFNNNQQNDLERYVQAGGGLVIAPNIPESILNWPWYKGLQTAAIKAGNEAVMIYDGGNIVRSDFKDEKKLKRSLKSLLKNALNYSKVTTERVPEWSRFDVEVLETFMYEPMEMVIFKDGRVLYLERRGDVKIYSPREKKSKVISTFDVSITGNYEDGMLGVALDPDFDTNNFIYIMYSPAGNVPKQNISRFVLKGDSLVKSSEKIVLEIPTQRETCCHSGGHLEFGPNKDLYISTGDNTSSKESDGFSPIDERPGRAPFDAQKSSGNTNDLRGKILRIHPEPNGTYTIPDGNLFSKDGSKGKPEIFVMGARNPFRFTVDDKTGYVYWGDVGPDGGKTTERGPQSYDELNQAKKAGNYGWPYFVADNKAYADFDFSTNQIGPKFNPEKPENTSVNNTGAKILPPAQKPMIWYPYGESKEFPILGKGSRSAMGGPVYYQDQYPEHSRFPKFFDGKLFIYEWARNWVKLVSFDKNGDFSRIEDFMPNEEWHKPIDMKFGPDGSLYVLEYGANYFEHNQDSRLIKITYREGNRSPVANITADKTIGAAPLTVGLSAEKSFDFDQNDELTYSWSTAGMEGPIESSPKVSFTYSNPGIYHPTLTVTDKGGLKSSKSVEIKVGNEVPVVKIDLKEDNKSFYRDHQILKYKVNVSDKEDGTLANGIVPGSVFVSFDYLKEGKDLALLASNNQMGGGVKFLKGKTLLESSDCKSCHDITKQSIGPSYLAIAARYKDKDANDALSEKILKGGNGNWGKNVMAAHPQHKKEETDAMVRYILSLSDSKNVGQPLEGSIVLDEHSKTNSTGAYILRAVYTDRGTPDIGPLTGNAMIILRNPKVQAEDYQFFKNAGKRHIDGSDVSYVSDLENDSYIGFNKIDLTSVEKITFNAGAPVQGSTIEIRVDQPDGKKIGEAKVIQSEKEDEMRQVETSLTEISGLHDIYIVFKNEKEKENIAYLDWIYFGLQPSAISKEQSK